MVRLIWEFQLGNDSLEDRAINNVNKCWIAGMVEWREMLSKNPERLEVSTNGSGEGKNREKDKLQNLVRS